MKNSIKEIWKEGFLNEKSLVAPKINDSYNQKSKHVVDKVKRMFRVNLIVLVIMSIVYAIIHYFLDAIWQGVATSVLLLLTAWYSNRLIHSIKTQLRILLFTQRIKYYPKFSYNYSISYAKKPQDILLVLQATYSAKYFIDAMSSAGY